MGVIAEDFPPWCFHHNPVARHALSYLGKQRRKEDIVAEAV
jgi:hypothetical protein